MDELKLPVYEIPQVVSFSDEDILEELGPAQTQVSGTGQGMPSY